MLWMRMRWNAVLSGEEEDVEDEARECLWPKSWRRHWWWTERSWLFWARRVSELVASIRVITRRGN